MGFPRIPTIYQMTMKLKKITIIFLAMLIFLLTVAGCGEKPATRVTLGVLPLTSSAPLFIAMDKGYFAREGLDIEPQWFDAAQPLTVATAASRIDVGGTGITASLYNMAATGQKIYIVADKGREEKGYSSSTLMISKENYAKGINSLKELKGKRIGVTQIGSTFQYMLGRMLEKENMNLNDVEIVPLGKISGMMAALKSGQIDACILNEPNVGKAEKEGYAKALLPVSDLIDYQVSAIFFSPRFCLEKDKALRFMRAYNDACRFYYDNGIKNKSPEGHQEVIAIIAKYVKAPVEDIEASLPYIDREGKIMRDDIAKQIEWYKKQDLLRGDINVDNIVDEGFMERAIRSYH